MFSISVNLPEYMDNSLNFSSGEVAKQANGSVKVSFGDTVVLVTACMSKEPKEGVSFLPLTVEYRERTYAMGKIPGGFIKREGRPKDSEILCARLIDRPLRPFFPEGFTNDTQIAAVVLSSDGENDPDVLAVNGASCALVISDIPFLTPIGAVRVCKVDGKFVINSTYRQREKSSFDIVVAGTEEKIVMIEAGAKEANEDDISSAIEYAHSVIKEIVKAQKSMRGNVGKSKKEFLPVKIDDEALKAVEDKARLHMDRIYAMSDKKERETAIAGVVSEIESSFNDRDDITPDMIMDAFSEVEKKYVKLKILKDGLRPDSRSIDEIRPIECKISVLPRTHGSAIFTRGQTQSLSVITLGTSSDEQMVEALEGDMSKRFMLHYTFPPFSVGEVKPMRGPSRREIGHGALAEKSLLPVLPDKERFPYTMRVVSEILESNGSSSMATVCAASLALMDAGVPVKTHVAGIAMGLVHNESEYKILTDIAGLEDHYGEMDFKVAGTKRGITAIQLDVKNDGLNIEIIKETLLKAKKARLFILGKMDEAIASPRDKVSEYAPKIKSIKIDIDKIGEVIGPGGRTIRKISREHNVVIDINDDEGRVFVVAEKEEDLNKAVDEILILTKDVSVGDIYDAKVVKITNFGAFCDLAPGKSGLLHISELSDKFVKDVRDFLTEGDIVRVKVVNVDAQGKITLSKKQAE